MSGFGASLTGGPPARPPRRHLTYRPAARRAARQVADRVAALVAGSAVRRSSARSLDVGAPVPPQTASPCSRGGSRHPFSVATSPHDGPAQQRSRSAVGSHVAAAVDSAELPSPPDGSAPLRPSPRPVRRLRSRTTVRSRCRALRRGPRRAVRTCTRRRRASRRPCASRRATCPEVQPRRRARPRPAKNGVTAGASTPRARPGRFTCPFRQPRARVRSPARAISP